MNEVIKSLGLREWSVIWEPDETQPNRGRILPETKVILIHDKEPSAAFRTLLHEVLELKLRSSSNMERSLSNVLLDWANTEIYKAKERAIEEVLDLIFDLVEGSDEVRDILKEARTN